MFSESKWENGEIDQKWKPIKNSKLKKTVTKPTKWIDIKQEMRELELEVRSI